MNNGTDMAFFPIFLSVVFVVRNQADEIQHLLTEATEKISSLVSDYELVIVDNASSDESIAILKALSAQEGLPNLQVYALTKEVNADTASWVGIENALGDFVAVADPLVDDINFLPLMLDKAAGGADVVFATNEQEPPQSLAYRISFSAFNALYRAFNGINLAKEASQYRVLSKRVVNYILQHPQPSIAYRHLPASAGFAKAALSYKTTPRTRRTKHFGDSFDRGMRLLASSTRAPMRLVTALSLFGAVSNLIYSGYVIASAFFKADIAPGWTTLSLQQSGMFFLISLVLLVLGEYIMHMASLSNEGPPYYVGQEFTSAVMTRRERLNVEDVKAASPSNPVTVPPRVPTVGGAAP